jgi:fructokinase
LEQRNIIQPKRIKKVNNMVRFGIDLGGTKTELIALDVNGKQLDRFRTPTPSLSYEALVQNIVSMVHQAQSNLGLSDAQTSLGVGIPGSLSARDNTVRNANTVVLNGRPLQTDLQQILKRPVAIENDANCLALSEATDGAGANGSVVFSVILGTGVGGGLAVNKRVIAGHNRVAGEWGHNPLPWALGQELPGPSCYCGRHGCIETWLSGPSFAADFRKTCLLSDPNGDVMLKAPDIVAASLDQTNPLYSQARAALARYADRLARSLAGVINILDPDVFVVGGGMSNVRSLFPTVAELLSNHVIGGSCSTPLVQAQHGDSSGVRGAAWLPSTR